MALLQRLEALTISSELHAAAPPRFRDAIRQQPWRGGLEPAVDHELFEVTDIEGSIPKELQGTLFRNGCGRIRCGDALYGHWFDGDGYVTQCTFRDSRVRFQARYVRAAPFVAQQRAAAAAAPPPAAAAAAAAAAAYPVRRAWTPRAGGWLGNFARTPQNPANTSVQLLGGRLLALCEGGAPAELDPATLRTLPRPFDFGGALRSFYSAHPSVDPVTGEVFNVGVALEPPAFPVRAVRADARTGALSAARCDVPVPPLAFVHDTALSSRYLVFVVPPYRDNNMIVTALKATPPGKAFRWDASAPTRAYFVDRRTMTLAAAIDVAPPFSAYHLVSAWEREGDGATVVMVSSHRGAREDLEAAFSDLYAGQLTPDCMCDLVEYAFDVERGAFLGVSSVATPPDGSSSAPRCGELTTLDARFATGTRRPRCLFVNALLRDDAGFANGVQSIDTETGACAAHDFGPGRYAGESVFVPRSAAAAEGDGFLLTYVYDATTHTSDVVIMDATDIAAAPLARARLPFHVPFSFHGCFTPETFV